MLQCPLLASLLATLRVLSLPVGCLCLTVVCALHACPRLPAQESQNPPRVTAVAQVAFTEGPVWHPDGSVYFTDVASSRIMRRDPTGQVHEYRKPSGKANGLVFDLSGRLLACEGGARRVTRTEQDGSLTVLADHYRGQQLNSPNDITIDSTGTIFFTDPRYGPRTDMQIVDEAGRAVEGVYSISPDGRLTQLLAHEVQRPNGLAISPDEKYLYVADNANDNAGSARKLWRFELNAERSVVPGSQHLLFDWGTERGPDGMAIDSQGVLYVTAGLNDASPHETAVRYPAAVYVIAPDSGQLLRTIPVPIDMITNCAFGGEDLKTLYITSGHKLWSIPVETPGHVVWLDRDR